MRTVKCFFAWPNPDLFLNDLKIGPRINHSVSIIVAVNPGGGGVHNFWTILY